MVGAALDRSANPRVEGVVGGLEPEQEQRRPVGDAGRRGRLQGVEEAAVGREEAGLGDGPYRLGAGGERREVHTGRRLEPDAVLHPHPRLGDDAKGALGP